MNQDRISELNFADHAHSIRVEVIENELLAQDIRRVRFGSPELASQVVPGQFFMVRDPASDDPLIGRAFALYDVASGAVRSDSNAITQQQSDSWVDLVYLVKGKLTSSLARKRPGDEIAVWGPLGNGFAPVETNHLIMVAGGIGQTPFVTLAREALGKQQFGSTGRRSGYAQQVSFCYGARTASSLAGLDDFAETGASLHLATEDGSRGHHGRVTDLLIEILKQQDKAQSARIVCCGPEPMMEAVGQIAKEFQVQCDVSLETPMACGIGICFTCVAKVGCPDDWDFKRTCVEGPVFDSRSIVWD